MPASSPVLTSAPILIVEDKDSLRAMLRHALEAQGHDVVEAVDEAEATRAVAARSSPDSCCPTCGCRSAMALACCAPRKTSIRELPVIVMTAYGSIQDAVAAMKAGAIDFLAKPVDPDHLLLLVERSLHSAAWRAKSSCSKKSSRCGAARRESSATTPR